MKELFTKEEKTNKTLKDIPSLPNTDPSLPNTDRLTSRNLFKRKSNMVSSELTYLSNAT